MKLKKEKKKTFGRRMENNPFIKIKNACIQTQYIQIKYILVTYYTKHFMSFKACSPSAPFSLNSKKDMIAWWPGKTVQLLGI